MLCSLVRDLQQLLDGAFALRPTATSCRMLPAFVVVSTVRGQEEGRAEEVGVVVEVGEVVEGEQGLNKPIPCRSLSAPELQKLEARVWSKLATPKAMPPPPPTQA